MQLVAILDTKPGQLAKCLFPVLKLIRTRFLTEFKMSNTQEVSQQLSVVKVFTFTESLAKVKFKTFKTSLLNLKIIIKKK